MAMNGKNFFFSSHSQAKYVKRGYGQVEPNHLSAQHTGQIYAQLPAAADIEMLENGQFVKYDYKTRTCNFEGVGEWMLVFNEVKIYRDDLPFTDADFAMIKDDYDARVYSPVDYKSLNPQYILDRFFTDEDGNPNPQTSYQTRFFGGLVRSFKKDEETGQIVVDKEYDRYNTKTGELYEKDAELPEGVKASDVAKVKKLTKAEDPYEFWYNEDPFHKETYTREPELMPEGTVMVPRVFKTNIGDIYTTNMIDEETLELGDVVSPRAADGILCKDGDGSIQWEVVKVYTTPDMQPGVKLMRIA